MNYSPSDAHNLARRLAGLELVGQGYNRHLYDIVAGSVRLGPIWCFRCRYERGFGLERATYGWLVAVLELDREVGTFALCPRDLPDSRLAERFAHARSSDGGAGEPPADTPTASAARAWGEGLTFPAVLECRDRRVCLAEPDRASAGQYERLLAAIQQGAEEVAGGTSPHM